jgi:hypothetical protein
MPGLVGTSHHFHASPRIADRLNHFSLALRGDGKQLEARVRATLTSMPVVPMSAVAQRHVERKTGQDARNRDRRRSLDQVVCF